MSDPLDQILNSYAAQAGTGAKREVTVADFEKVLESTPLFMRETPKGVDDDNYVLEALRSLVFEGEGDGECVRIPAYSQRSLRISRTTGTSCMRKRATRMLSKRILMGWAPRLPPLSD